MKPQELLQQFLQESFFPFPGFAGFFSGFFMWLRRKQRIHVRFQVLSNSNILCPGFINLLASRHISQLTRQILLRSPELKTPDIVSRFRKSVNLVKVCLVCLLHLLGNAPLYLTECRRPSVPGGNFTLHAAGFQNIGHCAGCPLASQDQSNRTKQLTCCHHI